MNHFEKFNDKINKYISNQKEDRERYNQLKETLKKRTQAHYLQEMHKENQASASEKRKRKLEGKAILKSKAIIEKPIQVLKNMFSFTHENIKCLYSFKKLPNINKSVKIKIFASVFLTLVILFSSLYIMDNLTAYKVIFNGEEIGVVRDPESVLYLTELLDDKLDIVYNADVHIRNEAFDFEKVRGLNIKLTSDDELLDYFTYFSNLEAIGYSVLINDKEVAMFSKKKEAEKFLDEIRNVYIEKEEETIEYEKVYFLENVTIEEKETAISSLSNYDAALTYVLKGTTEEKIYKVKKGENYWTIADKYNITPEELEAANPSIHPDKIQIGQEISLIVPKPLITVVSLEKRKYYEKIPYEISYENTGALFKGENAIKKSGKSGKREILAEIERQNGIEVSRTEIESKIIEEPGTQVVLVGTNKLPPLIGTGSFDQPARGTLTSRYGIRWGRMHTGIDIAASTGTTIRAADGGVVTYTGWKGNYGLVAIVDHGQNKSTLYAHCSKILVTKGNKVYKGQKIAEIGSTGRSTGPHVHFEVRINGKVQNPLNYVSY